jgi:peptidoglycan/LPS O-acetylase OafA/YrhL
MRHYGNLHAVRGLACLIVVWAHLGGWDVRFGFRLTGLRTATWIGSVGLDFFFVLSGFVLATAHAHHAGREDKVGAYFLRRAWRIFPVYWLATAAAVLALLVTDGWAVTRDWSLGPWLEWLTLAPWADKNLVLGQTWSLQLEVTFYIVFGLTLGLSARRRRGVLAGWVVFTLALAFTEPLTRWASHLFSPFGLEFLAGIGIAKLARRGVTRGWRLSLAGGLVWAVLGGVLVLAATGRPYELVMFDHRWRCLAYGPAAVLIAYGLVGTEGRWRLPAVLHRAGDASYSLYLIHIPVLTLAVTVRQQLPPTKLVELAWVAGTFVACVAAGWLCHVWVEKPLLNWAKRERPAAESGLPGITRRDRGAGRRGRTGGPHVAPPPGPLPGAAAYGPSTGRR